MTHPLRSIGITPLRRCCEAVRPLRRTGTFSLTVGAACAFPLASPARFSRSVQEPGQESRRLHAGCRLGSLRHPPSLSRRVGQSSVLTSSKQISTLLQRFAYARLSRPCLAGSCPAFSATFTTLAFDTAACDGLRSTPDCRTGRTFLHLPDSCTSPCGPNDARDRRPNSADFGVAASRPLCEVHRSWR